MFARRLLLALLLVLAFASGAAGCPTGAAGPCSLPASETPSSGMAGGVAISTAADLATIERGTRLTPTLLADARGATPSMLPARREMGDRSSSRIAEPSPLFLEHCAFLC